MRFLLVSPGSTYSTTDVYDGLVQGLGELGHEVIRYDSREHIDLHQRVLVTIMSEAGMDEYIPPRGLTPADIKALSRDERERYRQFDIGLQFRSFKDILVQARQYVVDAVVLVSGYLVPDEILSMLSRRDDTLHGAGVVPTYMVFTECPYENKRQCRQARLADGAFVNDLGSLETIARASRGERVVPTCYLPMGFHPKLHHPVTSAVRHDVVFVGVGYRERIALLEGVDWTGIDLGLYGDWRLVNESNPLRRFVHQGIIPNEEATRLYQQSRVGLNLYRNCVDYWQGSSGTVEGAYSLNPRAYELAACAIPQVSERRPEWTDVFGEWMADVLTFGDSDGLSVGVRALLSDRALAQRVAERQHKAVQGHSYTDRAASLAAHVAQGG